MDLKSFDEMNPEQQLAYKMGFGVALVNGQRVDVDALIGEVGLRLLRYERSGGTLTIERVTTTMFNVLDAAIGDKLLIDPTGEEEGADDPA